MGVENLGFSLYLEKESSDKKMDKILGIVNRGGGGGGGGILFIYYQMTLVEFSENGGGGRNFGFSLIS